MKTCRSMDYKLRQTRWDYYQVMIFCFKQRLLATCSLNFASHLMFYILHFQLPAWLFQCTKHESIFYCILIVQESVTSRPSSQMSHAASSGYGSARSNNRVMSEVTTEESEASFTPTAQQGRNRNSLLNSLRKSKLLDSSSLFRSLRMPRPSSTAAAVHPACPDESPAAGTDACPAADSLPLQHSSTTLARDEVTEKQSQIPIPAPRFQTLKRQTPHAYQNIPLPLKKKPVEQQAQIIQVRYFSL